VERETVGSLFVTNDVQTCPNCKDEISYQTHCPHFSNTAVTKWSCALLIESSGSGRDEPENLMVSGFAIVMCPCDKKVCPHSGGGGGMLWVGLGGFFGN